MLRNGDRKDSIEFNVGCKLNPDGKMFFNPGGGGSWRKPHVPDVCGCGCCHRPLLSDGSMLMSLSPSLVPLEWLSEVYCTFGGIAIAKGSKISRCGNAESRDPEILRLKVPRRLGRFQSIFLGVPARLWNVTVAVTVGWDFQSEVWRQLLREAKTRG